MNFYMIGVAIFATIAYYWAWKTVKKNKKKFNDLKDSSFIIQKGHFDDNGAPVITHEEEVKMLSPEHKKEIEKALEEMNSSLKDLHKHTLLIVFFVIIFLLLPKT